MKQMSRTLGCVFLGLLAIILGAMSASATQYAYVTNSGSNTVSVINVATKTVVANVPVGLTPEKLAITPDGAFVYVPNYGAASVSVIATATNSVVATVRVGINPYEAAITPNGTYVYVTNLGSGNVSVIATATNTLVDTITLGASAYAIVITPDGAFAYVSNGEYNTVSVIATATNSVVATIPDWWAREMAITPDGAFLYTGNENWAFYVSVIATATNTGVGGVSLGYAVDPYGMAITPDGAFVYLTTGCCLGPGNSTVDVIPTATNIVMASIPLGGTSWGVAITADGAFVYVANQTFNTVFVIATATNTVVATIPVQSAPQFVALTPDLPDPSFQFVPVTPCRLVDTRPQYGGSGPIQGGTFRNFPIPQEGGCNIPATAGAYSLNITVVPQGYLGFLTIWPAGQQRPGISTLNSLDGRIKANAAIVPGGTSGAVSVYVTHTANVILDIDGYFAPVSGSTLAFYPLTPCRVADTRYTTFPSGLGSPHLSRLVERDFPVLSSPCIPAGVNPQAYSFNFTAVPYPALGDPLGYLEVWPKDQKPQHPVSTLNNLTGTIVANAAIVPAGTGGEIAAFANNDTDLVIDIDGYFAPAGPGGLSLYPVAPCRVLDTRLVGNRQPFSGLLSPPVDVVASPCGVPRAAQAYVFNATVVPAELGYLTLWPDGKPQPVVSTLNALDGWITSNMAIVPSANGKVDAYASGITQLILDISSYFAP
jgi:YVTN family beta-propeller protein